MGPRDDDPELGRPSPAGARRSGARDAGQRDRAREAPGREGRRARGRHGGEPRRRPRADAARDPPLHRGAVRGTRCPIAPGRAAAAPGRLRPDPLRALGSRRSRRSDPRLQTEDGLVPPSTREALDVVARSICRPRSPSARRAAASGTCSRTSTRPRGARRTDSPSTRRPSWSDAPTDSLAAVSHWNKSLKGALVRFLLAHPGAGPADLAGWNHPAGYRFDPARTELVRGITVLRFVQGR